MMSALTWKGVSPLWTVCVWWSLVCVLGSAPTVHAKTYIIQMSVMVDYEGFTKYQYVHYGATHESLKKDIEKKFIEISDIYHNITGTGLTFQFEMTDFQVLPYYDNPLTAISSKSVPSVSVIKDFSKYLKKNNKLGFDIALLFTGYDLYNTVGNFAIGESNVGHVCQDDGVAVIELHNNPDDVPVTAHEIGHLLGVSHDGTADYNGGDATACSGQDGHLMNAFLNIKLGKYHMFTSCSAKLLQDKLDKLDKEGNNCLKDGPKNAVISGPRPGASMTVDAVCQQKFGRYSYFSRKYNKGYGDQMCGHLRCHTNTQPPIVATPAGLKCGRSKQCIKGECVVTPNGDPTMSETCPYGERVHLEKEPDRYCVRVPKEGECSTHSKECCYSCNTENPVLNQTADNVCRTLYGKDAILSRESYTTYKTFCKQLHCLTGMNGDVPVIRTHRAPDGLACGGHARCNNGFCVKPFSNLKGPDTPKTCPYGDQTWVGDVTNTCQDAVLSKGGCKGLERTCCKLCEGK